MAALEEALQVILDNVAPLEVERVPLHSALGRVLARDVVAPWDMPRFNTSARDGFALRSDDFAGEGTALRIVCFIPAGAVSGPIPAGSAARIMTGAPVPGNCDAVVPVEETAEEDGYVTIKAPVRPRQHIRFQGQDLATGDTVLAAGTVIQSQEIGVLASFGKAEVASYRKPRVAILSTGDELVELGEPARAGQIINSNAQYLAAALREIGAEPVILGIARDTRESLMEQMLSGLKADALITTAGVSVGDRDLVRGVLEELGVRQVLWKVDLKPGGPKAFGLKGRTPVFSLPGNPMSTMITFEEFVRPALLRMMGHRRVIRPYVKAILREEMHKKPGRVHCQSVRVEVENGRYVATTVGDHKACRLESLLRGNAVAVLPADPAVVAAGTEVDIHLLRGDIALLEELADTAGSVSSEEHLSRKMRMVK